MPRNTYSLPARREEKFWSQVSIPADVMTGCWLWTGCKNQFGYGVMKLGNRRSKVARAHRISWSLTNGPIPRGAFILHSCDVPACVNPAHLRPGTPADNSADAVERQRASGGSLKGEAHHQARLTDADIAEIRSLYRPSTGQGKRPSNGWSTTALAKRFGVSQATMWRIVNGLSWSHLKPGGNDA